MHALQSYTRRVAAAILAACALGCECGNARADSYFVFEQRSDPQGIFPAQIESYTPDSRVETVNVPLSFGGYSFKYWTINGVRATNRLGQSLTMVEFSLATNATAIAWYSPPTVDADADGVADYLEWFYYGSLSTGPDVDVDQDGFNHAQELARGYNPVVRDEIADGGILMRLSEAEVYRKEAQQKHYVIRSDPQGIVEAQDGYAVTGTPVQAPAIVFGASRGYYFGYWEVNGERQVASNGIALSGVVLPMTNDVLAIARFFTGDDSDGDGLDDWREWNWYGNLDQDLNSDPDADGFSISEELTRGYNPVVRDEIADGGILMRLSEADVYREEAQQKHYVIRSDPQGIVEAQDGYAVTGSPVQTPAIVFGATRGYYFGYWEVNGERQVVSNGIALSGVVLPMTYDVLAVARFFTGDDSDGDGLDDWREWNWYGNLDQNLNSDPDGDGFSISEELTRGYNPVVRDEIADGGILMRLSEADVYREEAQQKHYVIRSDPQGIVEAQDGSAVTGSPVQTPAIVFGATRGYFFGYWEVNGARQVASNGIALSGVMLPMTNDVLAVARFFTGDDSDGDGLDDWREWNWYGNLSQNLNSDPDGDGFSIGEELSRGYNPVVRDEIADGGIMMRLSEPATIGLSYYPRVLQVLVGGIMQTGFVATGGAPGSLGSSGDSAPAIGDWDGDQDLDLVVGGGNGQLRFYRNDGTPSVPNFVEDLTAGAGLANIWANLTDVAPALGDWSGDGLADLAVGGETNGITLVSSTGNFSGAAPTRIITFLSIGNTSLCIPALARMSSVCDLFVLRDDGMVDWFLNTGIATEPFVSSNSVQNVLGMTVPNATGLSVADFNDDGLPDILVSDRAGRIWEFRGATNLTFAPRGSGFAGSYAGFAERLTLAAGDLDGDGDTDLVAGFSQGGLIHLRNPSRRLLIQPPSQTAFSGEQKAWSAQNASGAVSWALVQNASGSSIDPTNGTYIAGTNGQTMDIIEAVDSDGLRGRAYVNVISSSDVARAGKAIIVTGRLAASDPVWPTSEYLANYAYNTLLYRGYAKQNIQYLSPAPGKDVDGDGLTNDVSALSTSANLEAALTNWAGNTARLFLYLVDHGGESEGHGYFRLNPNESFSAAQLNQWLNRLQDRWGTEVVVVIDCCNSGSFLAELAYAGVAKRIVVSSCRDDEPTVFVAGGLVSFSESFFSGILLGQTVEDAFLFAQGAMAAYQTGWLDDTQDGLYTSGIDGVIAGEIRVGASFVAGKDIPQIGQVMGNQVLAGQTRAILWANDVVSVYPVEQVWCLLVPPSHQPNPTNPVIDLPNLSLAYNPTTGRYEREVDGFTENGTYTILYYARDIWGSVSLPRQSYIVQTGFNERAIIVAGGPTNAPGWSNVNTLARFAFNTMRNRRLSSDSIWVMNSLSFQDFDADNVSDIDAPPTLAGLRNALTNWASGINKLTLYLVGNATNGVLRLNETEVLTAATLNSWLQICQQSNTEVCVVLDFDNAGSYLPSLGGGAGPRRLCVASASAGERAFMLNGGIVSFSTFCFDYLFSGFDLWSSFSAARDKIFQATGRRQHALLDGDRDGQYLPKKDGPSAQDWFLGSAFRTGDEAPIIDSVTPDTTLRWTNCLTLWAAGVATVDGVSNVTCLITPPEYSGSNDLVQIILPWNAGTGRYESNYCGFTNLGTYVCTFLAMDLKGRISAPLQTQVERRVSDAYESDDTDAQAALFPAGDVQVHDFHSSQDEDWVKFYAPTGTIFRIQARQLSTNSDLRLDLYYEQADGFLELIDWVDNEGPGTVTESLTLDLKSGLSELLPGVYYVRVSSADTARYGPDSGYELQIYVPIGGGGGVPFPGIQNPGGLLPIGSFYVYLGPPQTLAAGAGWRIQQVTNENYFSDNSVVYSLPASPNYILSFRDIPGFRAPTNRSLVIIADQITSVMAYYLYTNLSPRAESSGFRTNGMFALTFLAQAGKRYAVEESANLLDWMPVITNQVPQDGLLRFTQPKLSAPGGAFYRARYVP